MMVPAMLTMVGWCENCCCLEIGKGDKRKQMAAMLFALALT